MTDLANVKQRLYSLLPAHYRKRDADSGQLLRRVLEVIDDEMRLIEDDIATLYDNWFIETCEPWVVPYLGDLLGAGELGHLTFSDLRPRSVVARVLEYRSQRGTAAGLEAVIRDVLGWTARVVEYDDEILRRRRIGHGPQQSQKQRLSGVLSSGDRVIDIDVERPYHGPGIAPLRGDLGLFIQRYPRHTLRRAEAYPVDKASGRYTIHPLGYDTPLFYRPESHRDLQDLARSRVSGRLIAADLVDGAEGVYGPAGSVHLYRDSEAISPDEVVFADLSKWRQGSDAFGDKIIIDPERGRISLTPGDRVGRLVVDHTVAFGRRMAAGGYPRTPRSETLDSDAAFHCIVDWSAPDITDDKVLSLGAALDRWRDAGRPSGVIRIADSGRHSVRDERIRLPSGRRLVIEAADGARPVLSTGDRSDAGPLRVKSDATGEPGQLIVDGVVIEGPIEISGSGHLGLELHHCTALAPRPGDGEPSAGATLGPSLRVDDEPRDLAIVISSSLIGPIVAPAEGVRVRIADSILINATSGSRSTAVIAGDVDGTRPGPHTTIEQSTVLGRVHVRAIARASDSLMLDPVRVEQRQIGVMRHCYVALPSPERDGLSRPPAREYCIPASADDSELVPVLLSTEYGDPAFVQLAQACDRHIRMGAEDAGEMGAFHDARLARREAFLQTLLADYVPLGLTVDVFYID
ncbi:MAG: phage tail protein [Proteobacteria bacterium]|nr:phage tail protein [Pseudomonadota bacterium]